MSHISDDFKKTLFRLTQECDEPGFKALLKKFGHSSECLGVMQYALTEQEKYEDSGSYRENASSGYYKMRAKQRLLDQAYLGESGFGAEFAKAAAKPCDPLELQDEIYDLRARVWELEKKFIPKGPAAA